MEVAFERLRAVLRAAGMGFADVVRFDVYFTDRADVYDSLSGGANMNKFIRTEAKLTELVDKLFAAPVTR